ncbi:MAG: hypothetical protein CMM93_00490 [Rickettsiales bacterium]|nr:hypothetical protein [Rickettsiales bacterium]|tara:strand:- start:2610 stop:3380 length:771 start_codon:yes stop_codon:yes gene_type:complete
MNRFIPPSPSNKGKTSKTQSQRMLDRLRDGQTLEQAQQLPSLEQLYQEKLAELKKNALGGSKVKYHMVGYEKTERGTSLGAQQLLEKIAEKKAKKEREVLKKKMNEVKILPKSFVGAQGGRIDAKGNIFDSSGQMILKVDKATGKIKAKNGNTVGKYKPNSTLAEHQMCELISKYDTSKKGDFRHGSKGHGSGGGIWGSGGSIWGSNDSGGGGGTNVWGNDGQNIWGNGSGGNIWGDSSKNNIWGNKKDGDGGFWG